LGFSIVIDDNKVNYHRLKAVACCSRSGCNKPIDKGSFYLPHNAANKSFKFLLFYIFLRLLNLLTTSAIISSRKSRLTGFYYSYQLWIRE